MPTPCSPHGPLLPYTGRQQRPASPHAGLTLGWWPAQLTRPNSADSAENSNYTGTGLACPWLAFLCVSVCVCVCMYMQCMDFSLGRSPSYRSVEPTKHVQLQWRLLSIGVRPSGAAGHSFHRALLPPPHPTQGLPQLTTCGARPLSHVRSHQG